MPKKRTARPTVNQENHNPTSIETNRYVWVFILLITIAAVVPFAFSLGGQFVCDDRPLILSDKAVHSLSNIPQTFLHDFGSWKDYYRPLVVVSFITDYAMFGRSPTGYKAINLLLHVICSLLVFFLARYVIRRNTAALLAALIFAVHPAHTESVAWISGRTDLLATLFALASIIAFCKYYELEKRNWYIVSLVLFMGALLSKESVIVLPALILALAIVREPKPGIKKALIEVIPFVVVTIVFTIIRQLILGQLLCGGTVEFTFLQRLGAVPAALLCYMKILLLPLRAEPLYDIYKPVVWHPAVLAGTWAAVISLFAAAIAMRHKYRAVSFGILWLIIALIPVTNIISLPWPVIYGRFVYLPSVGFSLLFGLAGGWVLYRGPRLLMAICLSVALVFCAVQSYSGAKVWLTNKALADQMVKSAPRVLGTHLFAAEVYTKGGNLKRAIDEYQIVLSCFPKSSGVVEAHAGLIGLYTRIGNPAAALREQRSYAQLLPKDAGVQNDLGVALAESGDFAAAADAFERAVKLKPLSTMFRFNLARALVDSKDYAGAIEHYQAGLELKPEDERSRFEYALALYEYGMIAEARLEFKNVAMQGGEHARSAKRALNILNGVR